MNLISRFLILGISIFSLFSQAGVSVANIFAQAVAKAKASVVRIKVRKGAYPAVGTSDYVTEEGEEESPFVASGSGVIISPSGHILTNNHLIGEATDIRVWLPNGRNVGAKVIGRDLKTDLTLIKVDEQGLMPAKWREDGEKGLAEGDWIVAVGSPYGLPGPSVSHGIISHVSRNSRIFSNMKSCYGNVCENVISSFIQHDASTPQGMSGGGIFDLNGELLGLVTFMMGRSADSRGINFAISGSVARKIAKQLMSTGKVTRSYIGIKMQPVNEAIFNATKMSEIKNDTFKLFGAVVIDVLEKSPAHKAGMKSQDIIVFIDNRIISNEKSAQEQIWDASVGKNLEFKIWRKEGDKYALRSLIIKTEALKDNLEVAEIEGGTIEFGLKFVPVAKADAGLKKIKDISPKIQDGLIVVEVEELSEFSRDIMVGDVILKVQGEIVAEVKDFTRLIKNAQQKGEKYLVLLVARGTNLFSCAVELKGEEK